LGLGARDQGFGVLDYLLAVDCKQLAGSCLPAQFLPFGLAHTCGVSPAPGNTSEMKHGVPEEAIRLGLVAGPIGFEPGNDIRIQANGDGLLPGPIKLADFRSAPIENRGDLLKINVFVLFCRDGADVSFLLPSEFSHRRSFRATRRREGR